MLAILFSTWGIKAFRWKVPHSTHKLSIKKEIISLNWESLLPQNQWINHDSQFPAHSVPASGQQQSGDGEICEILLLNKLE